MSQLPSLPPPAADGPSLNASERNRHVLVVEDELYFASMLSVFLELDGFCVTGPVATVAEALSLVKKNAAFDCAVLDINLGGEDSFPVADALMERKIPFLFLTGHGPQALPRQYEHIELRRKPVEAMQLTRSLNNLLVSEKRLTGRDHV